MFKLNVTWSIHWTRNLQIKTIWGFLFMVLIAESSVLQKPLMKLCAVVAHIPLWDCTEWGCCVLIIPGLCFVMCFAKIWQFLCVMFVWGLWGSLWDGLCFHAISMLKIPTSLSYPYGAGSAFPLFVWFIGLHKDELAEFQLEVVPIGRKKEIVVLHLIRLLRKNARLLARSLVFYWFIRFC